MKYDLAFLSSITVMLVSADAKTAKSNAAALETKGFKVRTAEGESEAQIALSDGRIGIMVLDLAMPGSLELAAAAGGRKAYMECVAAWGGESVDLDVLSAALEKGFSTFISLNIGDRDMDRLYASALRVKAMRAGDISGLGPALLVKGNRELRNKVEELDRTMKVASLMSSQQMTLDEKLAKSLPYLLDQVGSSRGSIMLLDPASDELVVRAAMPRVIIGSRQPLNGTSVAAQVARSGQPLNYDMANGWQGLQHNVSTGYKGSVFLSFPIVGTIGVVGVVNVTDKVSGIFTRTEELALSRFIERIGGILENAVLSEKLKLDEVVLRESEKHQRELKEKAEEATKLKDKYVEMVTHDLRSPLTSVMSLLRMLSAGAKDTLSQTHSELLQRSIAGIERMLDLVERILDLGRFKTGSIKPRLRVNDAREMAAYAVDTFADSAKQKGISVVCEIPVGSMVMADRDLILEVLGNLISNAIKFSKAGDKVTLMAYENRPGRITVKDTGKGMGPEVLKRLFEPDQRRSTPGTAGEKGVGLGLALCREIVAAHGGELTVESEEGKGSLFSLNLPVASV